MEEVVCNNFQDIKGGINEDLIVEEGVVGQQMGGCVVEVKIQFEEGGGGGVESIYVVVVVRKS